MTEREMLLRAVCESPDDDTPRLVFADWLDENGEPERAEFIRLQIGLLTHRPHTIPWYKCRARVRKTLEAHERRWRDEVPQDSAWHLPEFTRGFLERLLVTDLETFCEHAERIFCSTPIREVVLRRNWSLATLSRVAHLNRLSVIVATAIDCTPEDVRQLVASLHTHQLTRFDLINGVIDDEASALLVNHFGNVVRFPIV